MVAKDGFEFLGSTAFKVVKDEPVPSVLFRLWRCRRAEIRVERVQDPCERGRRRDAGCRRVRIVGPRRRGVVILADATLPALLARLAQDFNHATPPFLNLLAFLPFALVDPVLDSTEEREFRADDLVAHAGDAFGFASVLLGGVEREQGGSVRLFRFQRLGDQICLSELDSRFPVLFRSGRLEAGSAVSARTRMEMVTSLPTLRCSDSFARSCTCFRISTAVRRVLSRCGARKAGSTETLFRFFGGSSPSPSSVEAEVDATGCVAAAAAFRAALVWRANGWTGAWKPFFFPRAACGRRDWSAADYHFTRLAWKAHLFSLLGLPL